jgi:IS30 family transposase
MSGYITFEESLEIESMIFQRSSFGKIAKKINKDRSTISRIDLPRKVRYRPRRKKKRIQG